MRIGLIGDSHFDEHGRFEECIRLHDWIADDMRDRGVEIVVHSGDLYERKSSPLERQAAAAWVQRVTEFAPFVIVRGNHDAVDDLPLLRRLETQHPVIVEEGARVHDVGGLAVACVAWPRKAALAAANPDADPADALRNLFRGLGQQLDASGLHGPRLLLMHAMVRGSRVSTGQPLMGCDFEIGLEDLGLVRADAYCLGHIHKGQAWEIEGSPVIYPGSPRRTAYGELEAKGYVLLEERCNPETEWAEMHWEFIEAPATPMVLLEATFDPENGELPLAPVEVVGAEVRLRYHFPMEHRAAAVVAAESEKRELLDEGAVDVKLDPVPIVETRARTPEVSAAPTLPAQLEAFWRAKQFDPADRRETLLGKLEDVSHV